jgi:hypothetical protein
VVGAISDNFPTFRLFYRALTSRVGMFVFLSILVIPIGTWIILWTSQAIAVHRVEALLNRIRKLRVREATFQDAKQLAEEYPKNTQYGEGNCDASRCDYMIFLGHGVSDRFAFIHDVLRLVGIRNFGVVGSVGVRDGRVVKKGFDIFAETRTGSPGGQWLDVTATTEEYFPHSDYYYGRRLGLEEHPNHQVIKPHLTTGGGGQAMNSAVTPEATTAEDARAYDFRLSCLSRIRGCSELKEIAPSSWEDYSANQELQSSTGDENSRYRHCSDRTLARLSRDIDNVLLVQVEKVYPPPSKWDDLQKVKFQLIEILKGKTDEHLGQFPLIVAKGSPTADREIPRLAPDIFSPGKRVVLFLKENELDFIPFEACEVSPDDPLGLSVIRDSIKQLQHGLPITALK